MLRLAAYEAAVGPALRNIIVIPTGKDLTPEKKRRSTPSAKPPGPSPTPKHQSKPTATQGPTTTDAVNSPGAPAAPSPAGYPDQQSHTAGPSPFYTTQHQYLDADYERLERQALCRRKVEALESLAHTAALFLAEYMTVNKKKQAPAPAAEETRQDQGVSYAAAAAGMIVSV